MEEREIDIWGIFQAILKRWWIVAILTVTIGASGFLYSKYAITPLYSAKGTLYISTDNTGSQITGNGLNYDSVLAAQELTKTYSLILTSNIFLEEVATESGLDYSGKAIRKMITIANEQESAIMSVTVKCENNEDAAKIVETILRLAPDKITDVVAGGSVTMIDKPEVPTAHSYPNITKNTLLCMIIGFILGCALTIFIEWLDDTIKDEEDIIKTNIPVLAVIPVLETKGE